MRGAGVKADYGCSPGYNGAIIAWSEEADNHNMDIRAARLNQDNVDNAIASGYQEPKSVGYNWGFIGEKNI